MAMANARRTNPASAFLLPACLLRLTAVGVLKAPLPLAGLFFCLDSPTGSDTLAGHGIVISDTERTRHLAFPAVFLQNIDMVGILGVT